MNDELRILRIKILAMTDNELIEVVYKKPDEYTDEAKKIANDEIEKRGIRKDKIEELIAELDPAPPARKNEILAWTGGTFYSRETPEAEEYVLEGQHVEKGEVIGLLEVMKMFNQIRAEFSGTIRKICVSAGSGIIVSRGQQLFEIDPDEPSVSETEEEKFIRQQEYTVMIMKRIVPLS